MTKYTELEVQNLRDELYLAEKRLDEERRLMAESKSNFYRVGCSENNSGGSFWLKDSHYEALAKDGFTTVHNVTDKWYRRGFAVTVAAPNEDIAERIAKERFYDATGYTGDEEGCNCCGRPFYFEVEPADHKFYWESED